MAVEELEDVPRFACPKMDKSLEDLLPRMCGHVPKFLLINLKEQEVDAGARFDRIKYLEKPDDALQDLSLRVLLLGGTVKTQPENEYEEHIPIIYVTNDREYNILAFRAWLEAELRAGRRRDAFHEDFIWNIFATGRIGDLKDYRIGASFFEPYDEKEILSANLKWTKLKLLVAVESDSSGDSDGVYERASRKLTHRRKSRRVSPISSEGGSVLSLRSSRTRSRSPINLPDSPGSVRRRNSSSRSVDSRARNTGSLSLDSQSPRGSSPASSRAASETPASSTAAQYSPGSSLGSSRAAPGTRRNIAVSQKARYYSTSISPKAPTPSPPRTVTAASTATHNFDTPIRAPVSTKDGPGPSSNVAASSTSAHDSLGSSPGSSSTPSSSSRVFPIPPQLPNNVAGATGSGSKPAPVPPRAPTRPTSPPAQPRGAANHAPSSDSSRVASIPPRPQSSDASKVAPIPPRPHPVPDPPRAPTPTRPISPPAQPRGTANHGRSAPSLGSRVAPMPHRPQPVLDPPRAPAPTLRRSPPAQPRGPANNARRASPPRDRAPAYRHRNRGGRPPNGPKRPFITFAEQRLLLNYIIDHNEYRRLTSQLLYIQMEHENVIPGGRSWHTLQNHFKRVLLRRRVISGHHLGPIIMANFEPYLH